MGFFTDLLSGGAASLVESTGEAIDRNATSDHERLQEANKRTDRQLQYAEHRDDQDRDLSLAQNQTNQLALNKGGWLHSGWRPAIGWTGVAALAYQYVVYPILLWLPITTPPEPMDAMQLIPILTGMLGVAGMRSIDKFNRVNTG